MARTLRTIALAGGMFLLSPTAAFADAGGLGVPSYVHIGVSLLGLVVAVILLLEALALRTVALGGAIAEKISLVILAILCLAASAIVSWSSNFVPAFTKSDVQLASEVLVIVAMALLAAYFFSVRSAMQRYLKAMTGQQHLEAERRDDRDGGDTSGAAPEDGAGG